MLTKEREILLNVIETYKDMPYLWDKRHRNYRNQELRKEGNKILFEIYKEFDSNGTVRQLVKKLQNLRTTFFKELKKVKRSIRSGDDTVYVPTLWYFEAMSFLASVRSSRDNNETENIDDDHGDRSRQSDLHTTDYEDNSSSSSHRNETIHVIPMKKKRRLKTVVKKEIDDIFTMTRESKVMKKSTREEENECDLYAQLLARKLKRIEEDQRLVLMNEIDNLVFKAMMMASKARTTSSVYLTMVDSNVDTEEV